MKLTSRPLGTTSGVPSEEVLVWTLSNARGMRVDVCSYGASVTGIWLPALPGSSGASCDNVAPCHQTVASLDSADLGSNPCMGATCGRVCNRTAGASFTLDGQRYELAANDGPNHIHGGLVGFHRRVWTFAGSGVTPHAAWVALEHLSPAGNEGYPGEVAARMVVSLTESCAMGIEYSGTTSAPSPLALTNHCYYNLSGWAQGASIRDHALRLHADEYQPSDAVTFIPTGGTARVAGSPLDFGPEGALVGERLDQLPPWPAGVRFPKGINTSFFVRQAGEAPHGEAVQQLEGVHEEGVLRRLRPAATLSHAPSHRVLALSTTHPCVHLYTCFAWEESHTCEGVPLKPSSALALECQAPPNSANEAYGEVPRCILRPGEVYRELTLHEFGW